MNPVMSYMTVLGERQSKANWMMGMGSMLQDHQDLGGQVAAPRV